MLGRIEPKYDEIREHDHGGVMSRVRRVGPYGKQINSRSQNGQGISYMEMATDEAGEGWDMYTVYSGAATSK